MPSTTETTSIIFRDIESIAEIRAVEDLQIETWGDGERDIVPLSQFVAACHVGGSLVGAFDNKRLVGFAYGFYGQIAGHIVHHSHMLAVNPAYRNHNLGFRLKAAQRQHVIADHITDRITWTFDPLQSLNAYFNFAKLGVLSDTYKINVYGEEATSFLHQNGTDRLFVTWLLNSPRVEELMAQKHTAHKDRSISAQKPFRLLRISHSGHPGREAAIEAATANLVTIEIPSDINLIEREDFDLARKWRQETRSVFIEALSEGFVVVDYLLENDRSGVYLLKRSSLDNVFELDNAQ